MAGVRRWNVKNADGHWFKFDEQQKGNSCGPACVKILKESVGNTTLSAEQMRGVVGLFKHKQTNTGAAAVTEDTHDWEKRGSNKNDLLKTLKAAPVPIAAAAFTEDKVTEAILGASRNKPALLGCKWAGRGGHWIVSMGAQKSDPTVATILDPWYGLQEIDPTVLFDGKVAYQPVDGASGRIGRGHIVYAITT